MIDISKLTPMQVADKLWQRYDTDAILKASLEAYSALEENDISNCLFWREVLNILRDEKVKKMH